MGWAPRIDDQPRQDGKKPTGDGGGGDASLVALARSGDRLAFGTLVARHRPMLLALCRTVLGDAHLAEDAAQEASVAALIGLDRLRHPERFGAWLAGIGLNISRSWLRERRHGPLSWEVLAGDTAGPDPASLDPTPDEAAEAAEAAEHVRQAVAGLPSGQRDAVVLFYLSGLTHREVAASLGVGVGAVKARLHKSRAALGRRLRGTETWRREEVDMSVWGHEMRVADVRRGRADAEEDPIRHVVLLEEIEGDRRLPIWVGPFEAACLARSISGVELPRPGPYQLLASMLVSVGGRLREVRIEKLVEGTFYAVAEFEGRAGVQTVDARPSDSLNLAVLVGAPIRVAPEVFRDLEERGTPEWCPSTKEIATLYTEGAGDIAASPG